MKLNKRSRKLLLSAGMLAAVATIPPAAPSEAACSVTCSDGRVLNCTHPSCRLLNPEAIFCGRTILSCYVG